MELIRILRYDIYGGILKKISYYLCGIFLAAVSSIELDNQITNLHLSENIQGDGTFIDYWIYLIQGKDAYTFALDEYYEFPTMWILLYMFYLISTCMHPYTDLSGIGSQFIVRTKSRDKWWISKSIWIFLSSILYLSSLLLFIFLYCLVHQIPISIKPTWYAMEAFGRNGFLECSQVEIIAITLILPVFMLSVFGMLQMLLMLKVHPLLSFSVCASLLIVSTYARSYFLIGNLGMPLRMKKIADVGLSWQISICILLLIFFFCCFLGLSVLRKKDIYH